jgi:Bacterial Ig domain
LETRSLADWSEAEVRIMHRISRRTAAALLAPWLVVAVAIGAVAAAPSSAVASVSRPSSQNAVRLVSVTRDDDSGPLSAGNPTYQIPENSTLTEGVAADNYGPLVNDATDTDSNATCCTVTAGAPASDGTATVNSDGSFSYVPNSDFVGTDTFGFTLTDTDTNTASGTVTVDVLDPAKTTTTFTDAGTPPAADTTTDVTFSVQVTAAGGGPTPTGNVTFTWTKTNGGPNTTTGTIGVSPLDSNGDATISGTFPGGGGQGGYLTVTATYSGDPFNKSSFADTVYYVIKGCYTGAFPADTNGQTVPLAKTSTQGYYIGQSNGFFTLFVVNPTGKETKFVGSVTTNGPLIDFAPLKAEHYDTFEVRIGKTYSKLDFNIKDFGFVTGFTFFPACGTYVSFSLDINGSPAKKSKIFLGVNDVNPATKTVDVTRKKD